MSLLYLDLKIYDLIPLWISILLYDFGAQLKQRKYGCKLIVFIQKEH